MVSTFSSEFLKKQHQLIFRGRYNCPWWNEEETGEGIGLTAGLFYGSSEAGDYASSSNRLFMVELLYEERTIVKQETMLAFAR